MNCYSIDFSIFTFRSQKIIELLFKIGENNFYEKKEKFAEILQNIASRASNEFKFNEVDQKFYQNFVFFYEESEKFLNSDKDLVKVPLSSCQILNFAILTEALKIQDIFIKYFTKEEIFDLLNDGFSKSLVQLRSKEKLKYFDNFISKISEFQTTFEFVINFCNNLENASSLIEAYKKVYNEIWKFQTGFEFKGISISSTFNNEILCEISFQLFPENQSSSSEKEKNEKSREIFINIYELFCYIDNFDNKNYFEKFFSNNLSQILNFGINSHECFINKTFETLNFIRDYENFSRIFIDNFTKIDFSRNLKTSFQKFNYFLNKLIVFIEFDLNLSNEISRILFEKCPHPFLLFYALNYNVEKILEMFQTNLNKENIQKILIESMIYIEDIEIRNYENFQTFTIHQFDLPANEENDEFHNLTSIAKLLFLILNILSPSEVSLIEIVKFIENKITLILFHAFRSKIILEKFLKILDTKFSNYQQLIALWLKGDFIKRNDEILEIKLNISKIYSGSNYSLVEYFWLKIETFLNYNIELMQKILLGQFNLAQLLPLVVELNINCVLELYFKYFSCQKILQLFSEFFYSFAISSRFEDIERFLYNYFVNHEVRKIDLRIFLEKSFNSIFENFKKYPLEDEENKKLKLLQNLLYKIANDMECNLNEINLIF
ncbi:hypothetical protein PVAND_017036 [Polypedilum vanderplanki]|uniref:Uncharacterized protein n=1 Tax=Polypedilum vanderplanki TaxID=319348 RepID=A0A9J6BH47_POLVA|nr:hypothetical protein PVAND_017036 [Polypedilum vanderplanki]